MASFGQPITAGCPKCKRLYQLPDDWPRGETFICDPCMGQVFSGQTGKPADQAFDYAKYRMKDEIQRRLEQDLGILCP